MPSRILIADDTETVLDYLELVFQKVGFDTIPARGGKQAVQLAREVQPDLLLVDIQMPDIDGFAVCRRLRSDPETNQLPILLYSSAVGEEVRAKAKACGADEFLGKSLHHVELVNRVRDWLASRSLPGGIGRPELVEVALDAVSVLEVELVWLLGELGTDEFRTLAIACARGEQEALRFAAGVGPGPFSAAPRTVLGTLFEEGRVRSEWSLKDVGLLEGGSTIQGAMEALGATTMIGAPLPLSDGRSGAMLASGTSTLAWGSQESQRLSASLRYLTLALERWGEGP